MANISVCDFKLHPLQSPVFLINTCINCCICIDHGFMYSISRDGTILAAVVKIYLNKELECHVWTHDMTKLKVCIFGIFFSLFVDHIYDGWNHQNPCYSPLKWEHPYCTFFWVKRPCKSFVKEIILSRITNGNMLISCKQTCKSQQEQEPSLFRAEKTCQLADWWHLACVK